MRVTRCGNDISMVEAVMDLFGETLLLLPASSVGVERLHASTQINATAHKAGRTHEVIQVNSYVMSAHLERSKMRELLEPEFFGPTNIKAHQLLANRVIGHTLTSRPVTSIRGDDSSELPETIECLWSFNVFCCSGFGLGQGG